MIKVEECKKVLCSKGKKYSDEEVKQIREYLYKMARIVNEAHTNQHKEQGK